MKHYGKCIILILACVLLASGCSSVKKTTNEVVNSAKQTGDIVSGAADLKLKEVADQKLAIAQAKNLWRSALTSGQDLTNGPCLSESLITGWVLDIAHNPRVPADDDPANQCAAYIKGTAKHFVELDLDGNLIRAQ